MPLLLFVLLLFPTDALAVPNQGDVVTMMNNVITNISGIFNGSGLYAGICFVGGVAIFASGIVAWTRQQADGRNSRALLRMAGGVFLVSVGYVIDTTTQSFFAGESASIISQGTGGGTSLQAVAGATFRFCLFLVQVVGFLAVARAMFMFPFLADGGQGRTGEFFTYLVAGIICVNIVVFLQALANTLGGPAPGYLQEVLGLAGF